MGTNSAYKEHCQKELRKSWETQDWMAAQSKQHGGGGGGRSGCFATETPIETPTGAVAIADVAVGARVLSVDVATGMVRSRRVTKVMAYRSGRLWTVTVDRSNAPLRVTCRHSFLTARGWQQVGNLRAGDALRHHDGTAARVLDVSDSGDVEPVYNLVTEGDHTFFAGGIAVHNFTYLREWRVWIHRTASLFMPATDAAPASPALAATISAYRASGSWREIHGGR